MDGGAWRAAVHGVAKGQTRLSDFFHFSLWCVGEGNGSPLQCSCLENPRDGGAWWAAVYGVTQSRTRLKGLSSRSSRFLREHFWVNCKNCVENNQVLQWSQIQCFSSKQIFGRWGEDRLIFPVLLRETLQGKGKTGNRKEAPKQDSFVFPHATANN